MQRGEVAKRKMHDSSNLNFFPRLNIIKNKPLSIVPTNTAALPIMSYVPDAKDIIDS